MITYVADSLFNSPAQVLVNAVNTQGVMGKGIAAEFKKIYPKMFEQYRSMCERKTFDIGMLWLYKTPRKWILNFPTKKHWRNPSQPEYIEAGLKKLYDCFLVLDIHSIAFPALGCGNGGLDWHRTVKPMMEKYLNKLPADMFVHLPWVSSNLPEHKTQAEITDWLRSEPASLSFKEVWDDIKGVLERKSTFKTFGVKSAFSAFMVPDKQEIQISSGTGRRPIPYDTILVLWQQLRTYGYTGGSITPSKLSSALTYIAPILAELDYIEPVKLSPDDLFSYKAFNGLKYLPPASTMVQTMRLFPA